MKILFGLITILLFSLKTIAQSEKERIIVVQKIYEDTLQTDYRKVKFEISKKADKANQLDYSSTHASDTILVRRTTEYKFENGHFINLENSKSDRILDIETYKIGDTIFEKKAHYLVKKIYAKNRIVYAARLFPEKQIVPYNERNYIYNRNGDLIKINEKYNSDVNEEYKTVFDYTNGIVSKMTEFKKNGDKWLKEKVWEYDLLIKSNFGKKTRKRINTLLLDKQFYEIPW